ncbi:hypothetical protein CC1G_11301 [Coprinopsis cinerea okayama7|uniref:Uncharacterized protein n=1 Tax=Coprinopsis cinerea (strain Okayama-7 / 130 / ATCC MYA-4618 / FGSC 9003) TaxID=240176 RepID=A8N1G2_COPC7|nr:hypothetical protein CC1G_11301 [Coprinopsis cinerea okayama7\|eukprot:XP_001828711.2 hypothetical protein CC1G_11301 [Coprinopsis cinerea okayama7\
MRLKALDLRRQKTTDSSSTSALNESPIFSQHTSQISKELDAYKAKYNAVQKKYHNERRRNRRLEEANREWKDKAKQARTSHSRTQGYVLQLEKQLGVVQSDAEQVVGALEDRVHNLKDSMKDLNKKHSILRRRCRRLEKMNQNLKQRKKKMMINRPSAFRLRYKGTYTAEARALARYMVATGTAEAKVGEAIQRIGSVMGLDVEHKMSKRTVQRAVMEGGIAGDIQLAVEILGASKLCFSSDSTSHRHIEYESRTIALQVIDYNDPNAKPAWRMRTLGVDTSVNHTSETQVEGLKKRLQEIAEIFNSSPLAIREGLHFDSDDFAFRLYGTSGDHAADHL